MHPLRFFLLLTVAILAEGDCPAAGRDPAKQRPNVILILADDLGWSDTTLMGNTRLYRTPNLERLARRGMVFTRAYSASPLCSPTRASILTGQHPARLGITAPVCHLPEQRLTPSVRLSSPANSAATIVDSATRLDAKRVSLATRLRDAGYATGHFGKWHLGPEPYSPREQGFDVDIPHHPGPGPAGSFVAPWKFKNFKERTPAEHIEDRIADEAVAWIEQQRGQPFFLNYWQFSVHAPFDAKDALIEDYRSRIDPADAQRSPTYAAMVHSLDDGVGKILDAVDRLGIADNTAILFYSDNGGNMYSEVDGTVPTSNRPLRGGKATLYEGGIRVPAVVSWPGVTPPGGRSDAIVQSTDLYPTLLSLLGLEPTTDHPLDGVDLSPALRGEPFDRGPMFTYFPHLTRVPDHLPPGVSVHRGDWKLIRLFFEGSEGRHAYRLYNLREDLGERQDLSARQSNLVQELDSLIDRFLDITAAVTPIRNPNHDPAAPQTPAAGNRPGPRRFERWNLSGNAELSRDGDGLQLRSTGGDPWIATNDLPAGLRGPFKVRLSLRSTAAGPGMIYYRTPAHPKFDRAQSVTFDLRHDGQFRDYEIALPIEALVAVRLDPGNAPGEIEIRGFLIEDAASGAYWLAAPQGR